MTIAASYVFGTELTEEQRLLEQTQFYVSDTSWLLDQLGIQPVAGPRRGLWPSGHPGPARRSGRAARTGDRAGV